MILMLSENEVSLIRTALNRYSSSLRDEARVYCSGYSETGIELCRRRLEVDDLIEGLTGNKAVSPVKIATADKSFPRRPYIVDGLAA